LKSSEVNFNIYVTGFIMAQNSLFSQYINISPTPASPPAANTSSPLNPQVAGAMQLIQTLETIPESAMSFNAVSAISNVINLTPPNNFLSDVTSDFAPASNLNSLLNLEEIIINSQTTNQPLVQSPGVVKALNNTQYGSLLRYLLTDMSNRFGVTVDPTKVIYKMIEGKENLNTDPSSGIEISTLGTSDFLRIRFYFTFKNSTDFKFISIYHDQNYTNENDSASIIYLYEGSVNKQDFKELVSLVSTQTYSQALPGNTTALIPETGTIPMYLAEDMIPIVLEH
jgi:hypothetical protein